MTVIEVTEFIIFQGLFTPSNDLVNLFTHVCNNDDDNDMNCGYFRIDASSCA